MIAMLAQADMRAVDALERIATAQIIMAAGMVLVALFVVGAIVVLLIQVRALRRTAEKTLNELKPRVAPLVDRAKGITNNVEGLTDNVRRKVDDVLHTVEDLRRAVERGGEATEERVRRFAAVMDVVQSEAENLLLDATATARGVHETARALHEPRPALRRPRPAREERDE